MYSTQGAFHLDNIFDRMQFFVRCDGYFLVRLRELRNESSSNCQNIIQLKLIFAFFTEQRFFFYLYLTDGASHTAT